MRRLTPAKQILATFCVFAIGLSSQAAGVFSNHVAIENKGMHLSLTDANLETAPDHRALLENTRLHAEAQISWILHNTTSNAVSVIFIGMTNSFEFKLFDREGKEVPKTTQGKAMSAGPMSLTNLYENKHLRRLGGQPNGLTIMDFPKLTELFEIPSNGLYTLEVRYWMWDSAKKRFILSDPIRVQVIKGENGSENGF